VLELKRGVTATPITTPEPPPVAKPVETSQTSSGIPANTTTTAVAVRDSYGLAKRISKSYYNCLVLDQLEGKCLEFINPENQPGNTCIDLGRIWRYGRYQVYFLKRWRDGKLEVIRRQDKVGEVTPAMAGDALEDPYSAKLFAPEQTFWDKLNDFKLPIIIIILVIAMFFLAFTFQPAGR
jgi:hypothetical protein